MSEHRKELLEEIEDIKQILAKMPDDLLEKITFDWEFRHR